MLVVESNLKKFQKLSKTFFYDFKYLNIFRLSNSKFVLSNYFNLISMFPHYSCRINFFFSQFKRKEAEYPTNLELINLYKKANKLLFNINFQN